MADIAEPTTPNTQLEKEVDLPQEHATPSTLSGGDHSPAATFAGDEEVIESQQEIETSQSDPVKPDSCNDSVAVAVVKAALAAARESEKQLESKGSSVIKEALPGSPNAADAIAAAEQAVNDALNVSVSAETVCASLAEELTAKAAVDRPEVIVDAKGKRKVLRKKCKAPTSTRTVFESVPKVSVAHSGTLMPASEKAVAKTVYESVPSRTSAHASSMTPAAAKPQTQTVFEKQAVPSTAHTGTLLASTQPKSAKAVFEKDPKPSAADAGTALPAAPSVPTKTVFEKDAKPSMADAATLKPLEKAAPGKTVFEKEAMPSVAAARTLEPLEARPQEKTVFESQPSKSLAHSGTLVPEQPKHADKTVYENSAAPSKADVRWDTTKSIEQTRVEFANMPAPSKAAMKWDEPVRQTTTKSVFENVPQMIKVDASAVREVSDSEYTYETESEPEVEEASEAATNENPAATDDKDEAAKRLGNVHIENPGFVNKAFETANS